MQVGRPLKFQSVEEIRIDNSENIATSDFDKEKHLEEFLVNNIDKFVNEFLDDSIVSFEINKPINKQRKFSQRGRRVDLYIKGKLNTYIIELKNPISNTESRAAIGQILDYGREFLDPKKQLLIITTKFDINTAKTIKYYNLPIRYIYLDKNKTLEYLRND